MSIPETQLETWCNQGATATSAAAYTSIKAALANPRSSVRNRDTDIYLQGSYGNDTNIYADSDVDVVVELNSVWGMDLSALPPEQQRLYDQAYENATYTWRQFHDDVLQTLRTYYGTQAVVPGNKAIKVTLPSGRTADVVPALNYRKYAYFFGDGSESHVAGIKFEDNSGRIIVNYPKEHIKNGEAKNAPARTSYRYKQTVRMLKNARNTAIDRRLVSGDVAPSYFVECLLYNVPDGLFDVNRQRTFALVVDYVRSKLPTQTAVCQNQRVKLFGNTPEQWEVAKADTLMRGLISLWDNC
jgi:hypothetical protein